MYCVFRTLISPMGLYPTPVTSAKHPSDVMIDVTVISFLVSVPVLSEQMTLTQPKLEKLF